MNLTKTITYLSALIAVALSPIFMVSCKNSSMKGMIIITRASGKLKEINYVTGESWRYIPETQIIALNPDKPAKSPVVLSKDFYSARSYEISYDARFLLFAAQQKQGESWQIWEMNLGNRRTRQITNSAESCTDPAYLPDGRIVFCKPIANDSLKAGHSLFTCSLDGTDLKRITFDPDTYFAAGVLKDGRILTIRKNLFPELKNQMMMILRPDGTKAELFYNVLENNRLNSRAWETGNGNIIFIESSNGNMDGGNLVSVRYNRPLHSRINLATGMKGDFHSVFPCLSGKMLVTYRASSAGRYELYYFDPGTGALGQPVYSNADNDVVDAVLVEERARPRKLPSEVDLHVKTGLLLCQDVNLLDPAYHNNKTVLKKVSKIEVLGINSSLGIVDVEKDGSFYLKAMADSPFRIQALDENDKVIYGPCDWVWLRPNERRGCVGCHEDHELVPENRVPFSVKKSPVIIPVHLKKIKEETVELE